MHKCCDWICIQAELGDRLHQQRQMLDATEDSDAMFIGTKRKRQDSTTKLHHSSDTDQAATNT
jgi:hypothetical protein